MWSVYGETRIVECFFVGPWNFFIIVVVFWEMLRGFWSIFELYGFGMEFGVWFRSSLMILPSSSGNWQ